MKINQLRLLLLTGLLCTIAITQFLASSIIGPIPAPIHRPPPDLHHTVALLHQAVLAAATASHTSPDPSKSNVVRLRELEQQAAEWSELLSAARKTVTHQQLTSKRKIAQLEDRWSKQVRLHNQQKKVHLLSQLTASSTTSSHPLPKTATATESMFVTTASTTTTAGGAPAGALPSLRIYVYDMPRTFNADLSAAEPDCQYTAKFSWQTKYSLETYMHAMLLKSKLRTLDPDEANLFYVPIYVGCYLHHIGTNFNKASAKIMNGVQWIRKHHPFWDQSQGRDHVFTFTHDIGGCVAPFRALKNSIFM